MNELYLDALDGVAKKTVAVFGVCFSNQQGVARAVGVRDVVYINGVVLYVAQIDGVNLYCLFDGLYRDRRCGGAMYCTSRPHEG